MTDMRPLRASASLLGYVTTALGAGAVAAALAWPAVGLASPLVAACASSVATLLAAGLVLGRPARARR